MSPSRILDDVSQLLRTASQAIEDTFVHIGSRLESAIEILHRLSQTFSTVRLDLASDDLVVATTAMRQVAARIGTLAANDDGVPQALQEITERTVAVERRLHEMHKAVKTVDVLAVNAKIAAAHISSAGEEFTSFADEIGSALKVAGANLTDFGTELSQVITTLMDASRSQASLRQRQNDAAATVPNALLLSVTTIADRNAEAGKTAATIEDKTTGIARQVGIAVSALQIGDTTRQRIEHVEFALDLLRDVMNAGAKTSAGASHQALPIAPHIGEDVRNAVASRGAQLQIGQLNDTARELDGQSQRILAVLTTLTRDAHDMAELAQHAYGASNLGGGTFLDDLSDRVTQANDLLGALTKAQQNADSVVRSVMTATTSLSGHMKSIQSLESDIRLMGLNTTLKCSRLGNEGRSLTVIAQELRSCSNVTASEAEAIMQLLAAVAATGEQLTARETGKQAAETQSIHEIMHHSIERLNSVGNALTGALATLSQDTETVVALLRETLAMVDAHQSIGDNLRKCADILRDVANLPACEDASVTDILADLQALVSKSYTMAQERDVHARIFGEEAIIGGIADGGSASAGDAATLEATLEDMLF